MGTMVGLAPFKPIDAVVPFTYRDNATYLAILEGLRTQANDIVEFLNSGFAESSTNLNEAVAALTDQINVAITELETADDQLHTTITSEINAQISTVNTAIADVDQRVTDAWSVSNAGLDERVTNAEDRVTEAEAKVADYLTHVDALPGLNAPEQTPAELLAGLADTQKGSVTIAVASDSTANDITDWVRIWSQIYGPLLTNANLRREYKSWNDGAQAWNAPLIDQEGVPIPASGGTVVADNFSRTGELVGSVPSTGPVWEGKLGLWTADGNYAKPVGGATGIIAAKCADGNGSPFRNTQVSAYIDIVTAASAAAQQLRLTVGSPILSSDKSAVVGGVYVFLAVSATGAVTGGLAKLINGVNTTIATFGAIPGLTNVTATSQLITMTVTLNSDLTCSASVQKDGQAAATINGEITEADYQWLGGYAAIGNATLNAPGFKVDSVNITTPTVVAASQPGLMIANGAIAGSTILYHKERISEMWPNKPDILIISTGHNDNLFSSTDFLANIQGFIDACETEWGSLPKILISSQNREKAPATTIEYHATRQAAIRQFAMSKGYQYLPAFELFSDLPDSAITPDGVHPTTPAAWPLAGGDATVYGSVEWAKLMQNFITSRMFRSA